MPTAIRKVRIEKFKRFDDVEFVLPGHIVVAGPNDSGKTTLLQAIAAWNLALTRWKELNDFQRHGGWYTKAPIASDAHLHKTLHDAIYVELGSAAGRTGAQLIIATRTCEPVPGFSVTQMER